jgi:hypothetical protein
LPPTEYSTTRFSTLSRGSRERDGWMSCFMRQRRL